MLRYVVVKDLTPYNGAEPCNCAFCGLRVYDGYLREIGTALVYHNQLCFSIHVAMTQQALEDCHVAA